MFITTIERRFTSFDVYLNDEHIDTVYHSGCTVEEQKKSLIDHDFYDPEIEVYGCPDSLIPLTKKEKRELLEDSDVEVYQDVVSWNWRDNRGTSTGFKTEEEAMDDAIASLELDTEGKEDMR